MALQTTLALESSHLPIQFITHEVVRYTPDMFIDQESLSGDFESYFLTWSKVTFSYWTTIREGNHCSVVVWRRQK